MTKRIFTRSELYDLVWSKPMRTLAAELGISDVGLTKVCKRHQIPTPRRGYWNKKEAGYKVRQTPLPSVATVHQDRIEFRGATSTLPPAARDIIAASKVQMKAQRTAPPMIVLGKDLRELHAGVRATARTLRKAKSDADGGLRAQSDGECGIFVSKNTAERVIGILDAFFRALDGERLDPQPIGKQMRAAQGPDQVTFGITERSKRVPHVPTPAEAAAEERRLKQREQYWRSGSRGEPAFDLFSKAYPDFDTVWTGELVLQVEGWDRGIRRSWADGKTQTLEALLPDIVAGLQVLLATRAVERERRAEDEKRRAELARRRDLAQKRQERSKKRLDYLQIVMSRQDEVIKIRKLLDRLPSTEASGDVDRFKRWVQEHLAEIETKLTVKAMQAEIQSKELFPEVDPFEDPLGELPAVTSWW